MEALLQASGGTSRVRAVLARALRLLGIVLGAVAALWTVGLLLYRWVDPPVTPLMLIRWPVEGRLDYRPVALGETALALRRAVIASEDNRFCLHAGVDWQAVEDVLEEYEAKGRLRGASTITMQTARNLFLFTGGGAPRKLAEIPLAYAMEALWPKTRIIELYLSIAEWGPGIYGAEAAARAHFGKSAASLSAREAALLAAVLPNPRRFDAGRPSAYVERRAGRIMAVAQRLGTLDDCVTRK